MNQKGGEENEEVLFFSNRIYKHTISHDLNQELFHSLHLYNRAMRTAYAWQIKHLRKGNKPYEGSLHLAIKKQFQMDDYYANNAVQQANALRTSQKKNYKHCMSNR
ncbi:hypothetical protein GCM10020331_077260 [Ectobacillus funiculus]